MLSAIRARVKDFYTQKGVSGDKLRALLVGSSRSIATETRASGIWARKSGEEVAPTQARARPFSI